MLLFCKLLEESPESDYVLEGHMRLAEAYFSEGAYQDAISYYQPILEQKNSIFFPLAMYKTAWSHFRMGAFDSATEQFSTLIAYSEERLKSAEIPKDEKEKFVRARLAELKDESITYLALSFSETGGPRQVVQEFKKMGMAKYTYMVLGKMAEVYLDQQRYEKAIFAQ